MGEIDAALKSFKRDKIPWPDGWAVKFFLAFFDILGKDLLDAVECSRLEGRVTPSLNSTFIAPIPKRENPLTFVEYRPGIILGANFSPVGYFSMFFSQKRFTILHFLKPCFAQF